MRYPRGNDKGMKFPMNQLNTDYTYTKDDAAEILLISYGRAYDAVYRAHVSCETNGYHTSLLKLTRIFPIEDEIISIAQQYRIVLFFEEGMVNGGISSIIGAKLVETEFQGKYMRIACDSFIKQASVSSALNHMNLSEQAVCRYIYEHGKEN